MATKYASAAFIILFFIGECSSQSNYWAQTNGPFSGSVSSLVSSGQGSIYAGLTDGSIYRSTDGGASWAENKIGWMINALAAREHNLVFAGMNGSFARSRDNGNHWETTVYNVNINCMALVDSGHLLAGTGYYASNGLCIRSTDDGSSWSSSFVTNSPVLSLLPRGNGIIFAGTWGNGVFRSTDNGITWQTVNVGITVFYPTIRAMSQSAGGSIFIGTNGGLYRSTNQGDNWIRVGSGLMDTVVLSMAISRANHIFIGTGSGIYRSVDNGDSCHEINNGMSNSHIRSLAINGDTVVLAGTDQGVHKSSNNGDLWSLIGLPTARLSTLIALPDSSILAGTTGNGLFRRWPGSNRWVMDTVFLTTAWTNSFVVDSTLAIYAGTSYDDEAWPSGVHRSTDNGSSWLRVVSGLTDIDVRCLGISASGSLLAGTRGRGIFRSTNRGSSWIQTSLRTHMIQTFASGHVGLLFAGTNEGGAYRSSDDGLTWTAINNGLTALSVRSLTITPSADVYAGTDGDGVYRTTDNGNNWIQINNGLIVPYVHALISNSRGDVFAGTAWGRVFRTRNDGISWEDISTGIPQDLHIQSFTIDASNHLFACGYRYTGAIFGAVFRSEFPTTIVENSLEEHTYQLQQNYPNPFNPTTVIQFDLPKESRVTLKIYDVLGREAATLVDEHRSAGSHRISWNASAVPSGVYFYRLKAGDFVQTKKLILLK